MRLINNKTIPLSILNCAFGTFIGLYAVLGIIDARASTRYPLILISTAILAILFLAAHRNREKLEKRKLFSLLTILWIIKMVSFAVHESPLLSNDKALMFVGFIDLYLLVFLVLFIGISFILKTPYFYVLTNLSLYRFVGILFLSLSLFFGIAGTLALRDWISIIIKH